MRINEITLHGFRGFNKACAITLDPRLTIIYAPNSYGKTSISEGLEWLLYGTTSRVEMADNKDEHHDSYRNRHLPTSLLPSVSVCFEDDIAMLHCTAALEPDGRVTRTVNDTPVDRWPFAHRVTASPRPFILQHTLKQLLLAKPDERFRGFARLLGLEELDQLQRNIAALCTKPTAHIPPEVARLQAQVKAIEARLSSRPGLAALAKRYKKGYSGLAVAHVALVAACQRLIGEEVPDDTLLPKLLAMREAAVGTIFKGQLTLLPYAPLDIELNSADEADFLHLVSPEFVSEYMRLAVLGAVQHTLDRISMLDLGLKALAMEPNICPFCGQPIEAAHADHIAQEHTRLHTEHAQHQQLEKRRRDVRKHVASLRDRLNDSYQRHTSRIAPLLTQRSQLEKLQQILGPEHASRYLEAENAIRELNVAKGALDASLATVLGAMQQIEQSLDAHTEDRAFIEALATAFSEHIMTLRRVVDVVNRYAGSIADTDQILRLKLDQVAGTEDLGVLVDLLTHWHDIMRANEMAQVLDELKIFRKDVDQYCANRVQQLITDDLTSEVMRWYAKIKTSTDPDVHFAGFDLERTARGDMRARRVAIRASSYGIDLASAVSSLSESKLNALGICMSLAANMNTTSELDFLLIDDPIQSLDKEHELQFIEVIQELVELDKQVIVLTHNHTWAEQVRAQCRSLNGRYYQITGYTHEGPHITLRSWAEIDQRLEEIDAITKDPSADTVRLQHAEEEVRIVVAELTALLHQNVRNKALDTRNLNAKEVRKALVACGVSPSFADKIRQTFQTTDPAHHAEPGYSPSRERIAKYYSLLRELQNQIKKSKSTTQSTQVARPGPSQAQADTRERAQHVPVYPTADVI